MGSKVVVAEDVVVGGGGKKKVIRIKVRLLSVRLPFSFACVPYERKSCIQKGFTLDTTTTTQELIFIE